MKKKSAQRPSKLDNLAQATSQDYAHDSTRDIIRRRAALHFEMGLNDTAITELTTQLADARERRAKLDAMLRGLASVIEKR